MNSFEYDFFNEPMAMIAKKQDDDKQIKIISKDGKIIKIKGKKY